MLAETEEMSKTGREAVVVTDIVKDDQTSFSVGEIEQVVSQSLAEARDEMTGDDWREVRDRARPAMRHLIAAWAECSTDGYGDNARVMHQWLEQWAYRQASIHPARDNVDIGRLGMNCNAVTQPICDSLN